MEGGTVDFVLNFFNPRFYASFNQNWKVFLGGYAREVTWQSFYKLAKCTINPRAKPGCKNIFNFPPTCCMRFQNSDKNFWNYSLKLHPRWFDQAWSLFATLWHFNNNLMNRSFLGRTWSAERWLAIAGLQFLSSRSFAFASPSQPQAGWSATTASPAPNSTDLACGSTASDPSPTSMTTTNDDSSWAAVGFTTHLRQDMTRFADFWFHVSLTSWNARQQRIN